jgi:hypothetical protein
MVHKILNLLFFAGMVFMNYLANALPINGKTTGQLSDQYQNLFVPAGITFSIWGLIYLLLFVFCIIQFRTENKLLVNNIGWLFALTCALNAAWIVFWHYEQLPLSLLVMAGLLISLIYINIGLKEVEPGITKAAFGIYLGWICIATIANVTAVLVNMNWQGFGISQEVWTIFMILVGAAITSLAVYRFNNAFIALPVVWAFIGIILKRQYDYKSIVIVSAVAIAVVALAAFWQFFRKEITVGK